MNNDNTIESKPRTEFYVVKQKGKVLTDEQVQHLIHELTTFDCFGKMEDVKEFIQKRNDSAKLGIPVKIVKSCAFSGIEDVDRKVKESVESNPDFVCWCDQSTRLD